MAGGMHGRGGVCVVGGVHSRGHVWWGGMSGRGSMQPPGRYYTHGIRSMSGRYASYWNAFLFSIVLMVKG